MSDRSRTRRVSRDKNRKLGEAKKPSLTPKQQAGVLRAAVCVAAMDGEIARNERKCLDVLAKRIGVGECSLNRLIERTSTRIEDVRNQIEDLKHDADNVIKTMLYVASVDGHVCENERMVIRQMAETLGMNETRFEKILTAAERHAQEIAEDARTASSTA